MPRQYKNPGSKPRSGNSTPARGKPTRVRRRLSKEAARRFDQEFAWATEDVQDEILSALILHAPRALFKVAGEVFRVAGPDEPEKPIIL